MLKKRLRDKNKSYCSCLILKKQLFSIYQFSKRYPDPEPGPDQYLTIFVHY